jgi:hypothetical protein
MGWWIQAVFIERSGNLKSAFDVISEREGV